MNPPNRPADGFPPAALPVGEPPMPPPVPPMSSDEATQLRYATENSQPIRVEGKKIIVLKTLMFPTQRCIKCNEPSDGKPLKRNLVWHHPAFYLLIFAGVVVYAIVAIIVRKKATMQIGLCPIHRRNRRLIQTLSILFLLTPYTLLLLPRGAIDPVAIMGLALLGLILCLFMLLGTQVISPTYIDEKWVHFTGAGQPFREGLTNPGRS